MAGRLVGLEGPDEGSEVGRLGREGLDDEAPGAGSLMAPKVDGFGPGKDRLGRGDEHIAGRGEPRGALYQEVPEVAEDEVAALVAES